MLKLEDLTKEELITFIQEHCIPPSAGRMQRALLYTKYQVAERKADYYEEAATEAINDYIQLVKNMRGQASSKLMAKAVRAQKVREENEALAKKFRAKASNLHDQWERLQIEAEEASQ